MTGSDKLTAGLRLAVEAVIEADVPDDLRQIAFERALDYTLGSAPTPAVSGTETPTLAPGSSGTSHRSSGGSSLGILAEKLGISEVEAEEIYDLDGDGLHLTVQPSRLDPKVTAAMNQIARLVVAGRQAAGLDDEWTSAEEVRVACEGRGRYSRSNFSTYVKKLDGDGFRVRGDGSERTLKANARGFEETGALIRAILNS